MMRQRCAGHGCPCPNHLPPVGYRFLSAEAVPPLGAGPLAGFIFRCETEDGARDVFFMANDDHPNNRYPLPISPPESWADAIARAERFVARKAVTAG